MFNYRKTTMLILAHPDDESLCAGGLLQKLQHARVVLCTSEACELGTIREKEAQEALSYVGNPPCVFLRYEDGRLHDHLPEALVKLSALIQRWNPEILLSHAYENGHQDHDSCSYLTSHLAVRYGLEPWEAPLYHRDWRARTFIRQRFAVHDNPEEVCRLSPPEICIKQFMMRAHRSQAEVVARFDLSTERFRAQAAYDYTAPIDSLATVFAVTSLPISRFVTAVRAVATLT
jgi:LmbE family N-acetylglucosaminyl deacetylase